MPTVTAAGGAALNYEVHGEGAPVLLITGTLCSIGLWTPAVIEGLAREHQVIAYDHRGMGGSSTDTGAVTAGSLAADAATLLDALAVGPAHVIGWSLGTAVAQELALARPDLVASLVLYGTWARCDGFQRAVLAGLRAPWAAGDVPAALTAVGIAFSPQALEDPGFGEAFTTMLPLFPSTPEQVTMSVHQWDADLAHDTADRLGGITAPTTVLVGEQDLLTPPWQSRKVADGIPGAEFVLVEGPGASHGMHIERTDEWLGHVRAHLARHAD